MTTAPAFRRILVGVDDSPSAQAALTEAIALAHDGSAELVLVHVTSILDGDGHSPPRPHRIPSEQSAAILAEGLARARAAGVSATTELLTATRRGSSPWSPTIATSTWSSSGRGDSREQDAPCSGARRSNFSRNPGAPCWSSRIRKKRADVCEGRSVSRIGALAWRRADVRVGSR